MYVIFEYQTYIGVIMSELLYGMMNWPVIEGIEYTDIDNPSDVLGQKVTEHGLLIQAFFPDADKLEVKTGGKIYEMQRMDEAGFYAILLDSKKTLDYTYVITCGEEKTEQYDAYAFEPELPMKKVKKFNAGIGYDAYTYMGSHPMKMNGVDGVRFAVWAPFAVRVSVVGDFNNWDGRTYQMSRIEDTGIFTIFIPEIEVGSIYKYEIKKKGGENILKADPYAFVMEQHPGDASIVSEILEPSAEYQWKDKEWIDKRSEQDISAMPINIYEVNIENFAKGGVVQYEQAAKDIADYVKKMKYTHIELMPVMECKNLKSLGYETTNFYAPTARYGSPDGLMAFVDYMHSQGIGVIFDFTVYQFASDESGMRAFDGSNLFEHMDAKKGINPRTGTYMFNYARPEVTSYLIGNAFMWIKNYHADGLKMAKVASMLYLDYDRNPGEWIPNIYGGNENLEAIEFIKHFNSIIHKDEKGVITIAEDNSGYPQVTGIVNESCLGFDLKWNEEWRKDLLSYLAVPPYLRGGRYNDLSLSMIYQYSDDFVVGYPSVEFINGQPSLIGRMTGDTEDRKFANMRLALSYAMVHPGKKMLFMGQDMAEYGQWSADNEFSQELLEVDKHKQINECAKRLNEIYLSEPSLYELDNDSEGFEWINNISARESILTFVRKGTSYDKKDVKEEDMLLIVCNFDAVDRSDYKVGVPKKGKYKEIFNSDNIAFGGTGFVNPRLKQSKTDECDGREDSIRINVPGLSVVILKFSKADEKLVGNKEAKVNVARKKAEPKSTAKAKVTETKVKAVAKKSVVTDTGSKAEVKKEPAKTVAKAADTKVEVKKEPAKATAAKAETKTAKKEPVKAVAKAEAKKEPAKVVAKPETKAEAKKESAKAVAKPETKAEAKKEPAKVVAKTETKATAKKESVKAATKAETKVETKKESAKSATKPETKSESKTDKK